MCNKAVDSYTFALEFVQDCCKTQKCIIMLLILKKCVRRYFWGSVYAEMLSW